MKKMFLRALVVTSIVTVIVLAVRGAPPVGNQGQAQVKSPPAGQEAKSPAAKPVDAKPFSPQVLKGIEYLVAQQQADGGWGQGGGWRQASGAPNGRVEGKDVKDPSDVANTAMALLALLRAGNSPEEGRYATQFAKGLDFINRHVEAADKESLYVTDVRDTQLQLKIGPYADTFAATWVLSEIKGRMGEKAPSRLLAAVDKCIAKIEGHQKEDGTFNRNNAWAAVLSQGLCGVAINAAAQNGVKVNQAMLDRDFKLATNGLDVKKGAFDIAAAAPVVVAGGGMGGGVAGGMSAGATRSFRSAPMSAPSAPSNAGIALYQQSVQSAQLNAKVATDAPAKKQAQETLNSPTASIAEKDEAGKQLKQLEDQEQTALAARKAMAAKSKDERFVAGFGNHGGEEFLSYMNISLALHVKGGPEWQKWDQQATEQINRAQNNDGSWSGHHCITGRTFCTSTALLTLMADRVSTVATAAR